MPAKADPDVLHVYEGVGSATVKIFRDLTCTLHGIIPVMTFT